MRQGPSVPGDPTGGSTPSSSPVAPIRPRKAHPGEGRSWMSEPRTAVLVVLAAVIVLGGGRRLLMALRARRSVARLTAEDATAEEIERAAEYGRAGVAELYRLFAEGTPAPRREAAGRAIAMLWARDELIAEEEQAFVRRGVSVSWRSRRRYPRALQGGIPITVRIDLPILSGRSEQSASIRPERLEWSCRVQGARRAAVEELSAWSPGGGSVAFTLVPGDFEGNGPHKLVLHPRVRTAGLTAGWEIELTPQPFSFEFDPRLQVDSLLASPDEPRAEVFAVAVSLQSPPTRPDEPASFLPVGPQLLIRNPPRLRVAGDLPCDLAHELSLEFEGVPDRWPAGQAIVPGRSPEGASVRATEIELGPAPLERAAAIDRPGTYRLRAILTPSPALGWTDPDVRSVWPGTIETGWVEVEVVRR